MLKTSTVFSYDGVNDTHIRIGASKALEDIKQSRGWYSKQLNSKQLQEKLDRRKAILEYMVKNEVVSFEEVSSIIYSYQTNPEKTIIQLGIGNY